jgi:hypothetical protein
MVPASFVSSLNSVKTVWFENYDQSSQGTLPISPGGNQYSQSRENLETACQTSVVKDGQWCCFISTGTT